MTIHKPYIFTPLLGTALLFSACASSPYRPVVDEAPSVQLSQDIDACQTLATTYQADDGIKKNSALQGALAGGVIGGLEEDLGGLVVGGAIGALLGSAVGSFDQSEDSNIARKEIVKNCLSGRGHRVVG